MKTNYVLFAVGDIVKLLIDEETLFRSLLSILFPSSLNWTSKFKIFSRTSKGTISGPIVLYNTLHSTTLSLSLPSLGETTNDDDRDKVGVVGPDNWIIEGDLEISGLDNKEDIVVPSTDVSCVSVILPLPPVPTPVPVPTPDPALVLIAGDPGVIPSMPVNLPCSLLHKVSKRLFHAFLSLSLS